MLDPSLAQGLKEKLCLELMHRSKKHESRNHTIGGTLSYMPAVISAPILVYAPIQTLSTYDEYQHQYGEYSNELRDANFETTLTFLVSNNIIPADAKTLFLNKIDAMFKQRELLDRFNRGEENESLYEAMACWEKKSLLPSISQYFDEAFKHKYDQFKEKLQQAIENPGSRLRLRSEFGSLVVENLLVKHKFDAERLTPIVMHFHDERELHILDEMYLMHGLVPVAMFKRHLVQLAKLTNDPDHYQFSALFFSGCLKYLKDDAKSIASDIAASLSSDYYANNAYAFTSIRRELFTYWINHKPEQITAIVKAMLSMPKEQHETAIDKFFFDLSYADMPESFYDTFAILLSNDLNPDEFIKVYTAASEKIQIKLLTALMQDETQALARLNRLQKAYMEGDYSVVFPRKIAGQLQAINPNLYQQDEIERLFHAEQTQDKLETDLVLLQKILENTSLTHDERRSEIRRLENINAAFSDHKTDACPVVMKMFDKISEEYWPELFVYFDAQIIHWSFPHDEEHLKLFYPDPEKRPAPRENTWLKFQSRWEEVLQGSLRAILTDLPRRGENDVAHWALSHIDQAFAKTETYFPGMVENLLKKFFLENLPQSIKIFEIFYKKFSDKYHAPEYFSQKGIYHQVASWLPEGNHSQDFCNC